MALGSWVFASELASLEFLSLLMKSLAGLASALGSGFFSSTGLASFFGSGLDSGFFSSTGLASFFGSGLDSGFFSSTGLASALGSTTGTTLGSGFFSGLLAFFVALVFLAIGLSTFFFEMLSSLISRVRTVFSTFTNPVMYEERASQTANTTRVTT